MRGSVAIFLFVSAASALTLLVSSCSGLPSKTCFGNRVNAFAGDAGADDCSACMQTAACCDLVGACGDDPNCADDFKSTQACLIDGGAAAESTCKANLQTTSSQALYSCVRKPCGSKCGIPSCDLDQAVVLLVEPTCDRCMTGACCDAINACYGNRQCKLFLECITSHCPVTLGASLTSAGMQGHDKLVETANAACGDAGTAIDPGPCLDRCLAEFAPASGGADDQAARCLAFGVYTCGAGAGCGPSCLNDGGVSEGTPYPEDRADSGSR